MFPLEGPFRECCAGNDLCSFQESPLLLAVAVQYTVRGLKGLTTFELDSSEIYLAHPSWLKSRDSN